MKPILIVDDEAAIAELIRRTLAGAGYDCVAVTDGAAAADLLEREAFDLVLLDIMMPGVDGYDLLRWLRPGGMPVVFITAKGTTADKVKGLHMGADDYIVKPFSLDVLGARVAAHLRREERSRRKTSARFSGELAVDYGQRCVTCRGEALPLARKEFDIVEFLSTNAGQVFDKERIYERVWGFDGQGDSSVVAEHIRRIRAKLAAAGCQNHIETVWGVGYKWKN